MSFCSSFEDRSFFGYASDDLLRCAKVVRRCMHEGLNNVRGGTRSKEQGARNKEQRAKNKEQGAMNKEQRTKSKEQGTKNKAAKNSAKS